LPQASALDEARAVEWLAWLAGWVHGIGFAQIWRPERFSATDPAPHEALKANGRRIVHEAYTKIEQALGDRRTWALESGYCIVDPFLLVLYRWGNRIGLPMREHYPAWTAHAERMLERGAVRRAFEQEGVAIE
jgi:glutathione S-transferase